eukprot:2538322-Heterocapsa_arctica.AAC.1
MLARLPLLTLAYWRRALAIQLRMHASRSSPLPPPHARGCSRNVSVVRAALPKRSLTTPKAEAWKATT